ncbi:STAS domain-containing protein [Streptomyces sp. NPDC004561]
MPAAAHGAASNRTVLALVDVTFMNSSGINSLITTQRTARSAEGRVRLTARSASVARLFQIVGLDES